MKNIRLFTLLGFLLITSSSGVLQAKSPSKSTIFNEIELKKENHIHYAMNDNGTYEVPLELQMKMGEDKFSHTGLVEKIDENYYFTFTVLEYTSFDDLILISNGKVGEMSRITKQGKSYTYTFSESDLSKTLSFKTRVISMDKVVDFKVKLKLNKATFKSKEVEDRGDRPARFVPVIQTNASNVEAEKGSLYFIPEASATLVDKELPVKTEVYYINGENLDPIEVVENKFNLAKIGKYKLVYTAESDLYKTSQGNSTKEVLEFIIQSKVGASSIGKLEDTNSVLPKGTQIQVNVIKTDDIYNKCKKKMKSIADNFQVFEINLYDEDGNEVTPSAKVSFYLRIDDYFDRTDLKIARFDNNKLKNYHVDNYGRYAKIDSDKTGIYIAYVEGVEHNMPIWGWVAIGSSALVVILAGVITAVVITRKKHKAFLKELETI